MNAPLRRSPHALWPAMLLAMLCALQVGQACAQANPGDIIVERKITPRIAYDHVPTQDDPVQVRATTFPAGTFDRAMGPLVTDVDLTSAHGSAGVAVNNTLMSSLVGSGGAGGLQHMLAGNSVPLGGGAAMGGMGSLGGTISQTVGGALAPLGSALGALK